ncbi:MAG: large conductance mechanosensitive channel protein MscL [Bacilli bacterium]|jgi:large conductance mechanosensitive channel
MKKFFREFKEFITRGNVLDMAVGIIIGGAFRAIVNSLVSDLIMPLISAVAGKDVSDWVWVIKPAVLGEVEGEVIQEAVILRYGNFIQTIIDFLIISLVLFIIIKVAMAAAKAREALLHKVKAEEVVEEVVEEPAPEPESSEEAILLKEIVELLKEKEK